MFSLGRTSSAAVWLMNECKMTIPGFLETTNTQTQFSYQCFLSSSNDAKAQERWKFLFYIPYISSKMGFIGLQFSLSVWNLKLHKYSHQFISGLRKLDINPWETRNFNIWDINLKIKLYVNLISDKPYSVKSL